MALIEVKDVQISFGAQPVLDGVNFVLQPRQRVALIGRNGEGKSTFFKIVLQHQLPDSGKVMWQDGLKVSYLIQEVPHGNVGTVADLVAQGMGEVAAWLREYDQLLGEQSDDDNQRLNDLHHLIDDAQGWGLPVQVDKVLGLVGVDGRQSFDALSGGQKRRVLLAQALVNEPDVLMLDEPTNHLDIESIQWLEQFLLSFKGAILFVTHDRRFLQQLATRIIELDRGQLSQWDCDYVQYLQRKADWLDAQEKQFAEFDKKLAQEEAWIRQGIKARRTRNEGRVRALKAMREERSQRRNVVGKVSASQNAADISGKKVLWAKNLTISWDNEPLVQNFSTLVMRGDKIGVLGPNGCGKSTLIKTLLGQLKPDSGSVELGTKIELAYFDQHRDQLDEEASVIDNLNPASDYVTINGQDRHVISYLQDFLFSSDRCRQPVKALSGGERNRLLLARVLSKPSNVLVMDEPTNDLDLETIELLEALLVDYPGTLILISHDRDFINHVVSSTLVFEGAGQVHEYVGGYDDWLRQRPQSAVEKNNDNKSHASVTMSDKSVSRPKKTKLSYKDQREYEQLPADIEQLEAEQMRLEQTIQQTGFYQQPFEQQQHTQQALSDVMVALEQKYERWEMLEAVLDGNG